jgi:iron complex transport system substrate-binding protein
MAFQNKPPRRIASFLPAATETIYALGAEDTLVAVTQGCDHPPQARAKPIVVRPNLDPGLPVASIDRAVREKVHQGDGLYTFNEDLLRDLHPDLILAQDLCQVCAPSGKDAAGWVGSLDPPPEVLTFSPSCFEDVLTWTLTLGERLGKSDSALGLVARARSRIDRVRRVSALRPPREVLFMEWVDPVFCAGHWIGEMLAWAGGKDPLARPGKDSGRILWEEVLRQAPQILVIAPCGFGVEQALVQARSLGERPGWKGLPAVVQGRVFVADGNAYFTRPSLRLVEGLELLAHLFHPEVFPWEGPNGAFLRL